MSFRSICLNQKASLVIHGKFLKEKFGIFTIRDFGFRDFIQFGILDFEILTFRDFGFRDFGRHP
jgi:hypothetical protein